MDDMEIPQVGVDHAAEHAHEKAHEMGHRQPWLRWLALVTAMLAVLAAIASLLSGNYANEAISKMIESTLKQSQASDVWAQYQSKGVKLAVRDAEAESLNAQGKSPEVVTAARKDVVRYKSDQEKIGEQAKDIEKERDNLLKESHETLETHHHFAYSVTLLQVAIGLCAMAAIIERKELFYFGACVGLGGFLLFITAYLHKTQA